MASQTQWDLHSEHSVKVFGLLQPLPSVDGVGEGVGVVVSDLLPLGDLPHRPHRAHPGPVDGDLGVGTAASVDHCCEGEKASKVSTSDFKGIHSHPTSNSN